MDTVIGNKYLDVFNNLDIEVSKKLEGVYSVDDIINTFGNFFFNRMFLDITSIKDYKDISNLKKLSMSLDMNKVILLLDKDDAISNSDMFLSKLVSMGIYNFTSDSSALMYLYNNPNIYRDVAHYQEIDNNKNETVISESTGTKNKIILGIKNVTSSAGATTFCYLLNKVLREYYSTMLIEIDKRDLVFFNDKDTLSIRDDELDDVINKYDGVDIFIIDLNNSKKDYLCNDILYLIEPSTIKLNKLVMINPGIFNEIRGKNIVINKVLLNDNDIANFEVESNLKVFYNIGSINDKVDNSSVFIPLLNKLGYINVNNNNTEELEEEKNTKKSIFDIFKK